ncbi:AI-2E family transporter [Streptomyces sp. NPDC101152]|uniref:AI-2E family transporter n=1 Tax=Streptomyces sp. NPDC101152 TaxID=3366116 RepID=UPI003814DE1D
MRVSDALRRSRRRPGAGPGGSRGAGPGQRRMRYVVLGSRPARGVGTVAVARRSATTVRPTGDGVVVNRGLKAAAAYAWRLLVLGAAVYAGFVLLGRLQLVAVALFLALVVTSVLRPLADLLARLLPRPLAVVVSVVGSLLVVLGLLALVGELVASEWGKLGQEFSGGVGRIERWLQGPPFHVSPALTSNLQDKVNTFVSQHRSVLINSAVNGASRLVEVLTAGVLALFCSLFFVHSGDRFWSWFQDQLPQRARDPFNRAGRTAWRTFAGYTRGIVIVAASNAVLVGIALFVLRVPLALPLTLLEFFAAFIPLVGSPIALGVATVVALATRGPAIAIVVLALIVIVGQIEGHVLHPLVMSWAVRLHPVVVAVSVIAGGILAGVVGAVVAVPMVSVAWAVHGELRTPPPEPKRARERP